MHTGQVVRLKSFGAFIALEPGIDGMIHVSRLGRGERIQFPAQVLKEGQQLEVEVESLDIENRRIGLCLPADKSQKPREDHEDYKMPSAPKPRSNGVGSFGELLKKQLDKDSSGSKKN